MAATIRYLFPKHNNFTLNRPFTSNRPGAFDRAYGKTWGTGIDATLPDRDEIHSALKYIVEHREIEPAWEEYCRDFLMAAESHKASAFPYFHEVEGFLNFLLDHEVLVDYVNLPRSSRSAYDKSQWDHKGHVAAFILRMQRQRMQDEKMHKLPEWRTGHHWCAAYVLWELLHWKHTEWQRKYIADHAGTPNPPALAMYDAVAPGVGLQSHAPKSTWVSLRRALFGGEPWEQYVPVPPVSKMR